jgi:hypothetical protein
MEFLCFYQWLHMATLSHDWNFVVATTTVTFFSSFPYPLKSSEQAAEAAAKLDTVCAHICCTEDVLLDKKK